MAIQIASLFAKISADTRELNQGLIAAEARLEQTAKKMGEAGEAAAGAEKQTVKYAKGFGQAMQDLGKMAVVPLATITAIGVAAKKAFDISEQGAAIIQTATSFDRLGVSIETMRAASRGTVDDMTLMGSTLTLVAGAGEELQARMLESAPQLMEIAKAANAVNPALGDTSFMYDSIARGIKRSSPLILDNLGIIVKIGEANETYAAAIGKTVAQLSAEDKQIALLNATMEAGNRLIEQAGGSTAAYGDAWAAVRAEIKNSTDAMKAQAAEGLRPLIGRYAAFLQATRENENALVGFSGALRFAATMLGMNAEEAQKLGYQSDILTGNLFGAEEAVRGYRDELAQTSKTTEHSADSQKNLNKELLQGISILEQMRLQSGSTRTIVSSLSAHQEELTNTTLGSAEAWNQYSTAIANAEQRNADFASEANKARDAMELQARAALIVGAANSDLTEGLVEQSNELGDLRMERADLIAQLDELVAGNGRAISVTKEATLTEAERALVVAKLARDTGKLNDQLGEPIDDQNAVVIAQMGQNIERYNEKLGDATTTTTSFVDNGKKIGEIEGAITGVTGKINELTGAVRESINAFMVQQLEARLAIDGWTEAETELFLGVAVGAGMMDEEFARLVPRIAEAGAAIAAAEEQYGKGSPEALAVAKEYSGVLLKIADNTVRVYAETEEQAAQAAVAYKALNDDAMAAGEGMGTAMAGAAGTTANFGVALADASDDAEDLRVLVYGADGAIVDLGAAAAEAAPLLWDTGDTGKTAMSDINIAAGIAGAALMGAKFDADKLKAALDLLAENDITIDVHFNVDELRLPSPRAMDLAGPGLYTPPRDKMKASGGTISMGDWGIVGEAGPELARAMPGGTQITPLSGGMGGMGSTWTGDIIVQGTGDPESTANLVLRKLSDRGVISATGGLR